MPKQNRADSGIAKIKFNPTQPRSERWWLTLYTFNIAVISWVVSDPMGHPVLSTYDHHPAYGATHEPVVLLVTDYVMHPHSLSAAGTTTTSSSSCATCSPWAPTATTHSSTAGSTTHSGERELGQFLKFRNCESWFLKRNQLILNDLHYKIRGSPKAKIDELPRKQKTLSLICTLLRRYITEK